MIRKLVVLVLFAVPAWGQQAPTPQQLFSFGCDAVVVRQSGVSTPATDCYGPLALTPHLAMGPETLLAPGSNQQGYFGRVHYSFSFEKATAKTQLPKNSFQGYVTASFGVVRNVPSTGPDTQHVGGMVGGGIMYDPTGSGKFIVKLFEARAGLLPGFVPNPVSAPGKTSNWGVAYSVGIKITP